MKILRQVRKTFSTFRLLSNPQFKQGLSEAGIFLKHQEHKTLFSSSIWKNLGYDHEPDGDSWLEYVHPEDRPYLEETWDYLDRGGADHIQIEFRIRDIHGTYLWLISKTWVLKRNKKKQVVAYMGQDVSLEVIQQIQKDFSQAVDIADQSFLEAQELADLRTLFRSITQYDEFWNQVLERAWDIIDANGVWVFRFDNQLHSWECTRLIRVVEPGVLDPIRFASCPEGVQRELPKYLELQGYKNRANVHVEHVQDLPKELIKLLELDSTQIILLGVMNTVQRIPRGLLIYSSSRISQFTKTERTKLSTFLEILDTGLDQLVLSFGSQAQIPAPRYLVEQFCSQLLSNQRFIDDSSEIFLVLSCFLDIPVGWESSPLASTIEKVLEETYQLLQHWVQQKSGILGKISPLEYLCWFPILTEHMDSRLVTDLQYMLEHRTRSLGFPVAVQFISYPIKKQEDIRQQVIEQILNISEAAE